MTQIPTGERLAKLEQQNKDMKESMTLNHDTVLKELTKLNNKLDNHFVSKKEFEPVKAIAYGAAGLGLTALGTAIVYLVLT